MKIASSVGLLLSGTLAVASWSSAWCAEDQFPKPDPAFTGKVAPRRKDSIAAWPDETKAPTSAPNIVLVLIDDAGFGFSSTFGGPAQTPYLTKLAATGLRYNEFHVNSLCSPSRASLLSGRNDHQVGFGSLSEHAAGFPGYNSIWPKSAAAIPEVLRENGYSTAAFGKWHNTPLWEIGPAGPFDHWPTGLGFDYFYGFMGAEDSQWDPQLFRGTNPVVAPAKPEQGYSLTTDLVNDAIHWLHQHDAVAPDQPFFLYFATGAIHTPHHVPKEWIDQYKGKFDQGWDKLREESFARQKQLGVIPANAELTARPENLPAWDSFSADEKKLLSRQAEVYAAYLSYADHEVGRLLDALNEEGKSDNTLVLYIVGDNGPSAEGGIEGSEHNFADWIGAARDIKSQEAHIDQLGSPIYDNSVAVGWAWAAATPFKGQKQVASYLGGTRDPLIVSWPGHIKDAGGLRSQFEHLVDIAPTIYDVADITPPESVNGIKQMPLEGKSIVYTWDHPDAPSQHMVQLFETFGNRAIYKDGWWAASPHIAPWESITNPKMINSDPNDNKWELYDLTKDYSQAYDVATKYPEKLKEMVALFDREAIRNQVYPLMPTGKLPSPVNGKTEFVYREGVERLETRMVPDLSNRAHQLIAKIDVPAAGAEGVIVAQGGYFGGYTLYVKNNHLIYEANPFGQRHDTIVSADPLPTGPVEIIFEYQPDGAAAKSGAMFEKEVGGGTGTLTVNGKLQGTKHFDLYGGFRSANTETFDVGKDLGAPVSNAYQTPFNFTGKIETVTIKLKH